MKGFDKTALEQRWLCLVSQGAQTKQRDRGIPPSGRRRRLRTPGEVFGWQWVVVSDHPFIVDSLDTDTPPESRDLMSLEKKQRRGKAKEILSELIDAILAESKDAAVLYAEFADAEKQDYLSWQLVMDIAKTICAKALGIEDDSADFEVLSILVAPIEGVDPREEMLPIRILDVIAAWLDDAWSRCIDWSDDRNLFKIFRRCIKYTTEDAEQVQLKAEKIVFAKDLPSEDETLGALLTLFAEENLDAMVTAHKILAILCVRRA